MTWILERPVEKALLPYLLALVLLFCASAVVGFVSPLGMGPTVLADYLSSLGWIGTLSGGWMFALILLHNALSALFMLLFGILFGIAPLIIVAINGYLLGVFFSQAGKTAGFWEALLQVIPHGIVEVPALLIAASYGLWLGVNVLRRFRGKESEPVGVQVKHALTRFCVVVIPLLIVAAGIETALILAQ